MSIVQPVIFLFIKIDNNETREIDVLVSFGDFESWNPLRKLISKNNQNCECDCASTHVICKRD